MTNGTTLKKTNSGKGNSRNNQSSDSDDLYNKELLKLANKGDCSLEQPDISITHDNPLCGDRITIDLVMEKDVIKSIGYKARSCALCKASAQLLKEIAPGHNLDYLQKFYGELKIHLKENRPLNFPNDWKSYGIFQPVGTIKNRHTCVLLPFEALVKIERKY
ncbi:iron-sulfur cluster assembly scaffold protein [Kiloniella antarctica]|uniref:Iron-sulfur cluster assembly scaffold protein n=1 Tax=Kiloniella antarctica TaxID=1550907 RepID=A0ABW5BGI3_9PROT